MRSMHGDRAQEFIDNAGTLSMFGAGNAASTAQLAELKGYHGEILGMQQSDQIICRQGEVPMRARKVNYLRDPLYRGIYEPNPFHISQPARRYQYEVTA